MAFLSLLVLFSAQIVQAQHVIDLSGKWKVQLDENNELVKKHPEQCTLEGSIDLPASLAEKGYGFKTTGSDFGILTPEYKYIGKASYSRIIEIPENWANKEIEIFLERVLWESRIFIEGKELSKKDALGTPHVHRVGELRPGKHNLLVQVDNGMIHNIGDKGHAYGEYTQSIWNGIVGRMEMRAIEKTSIEKVNIYPDATKEQLGIKFLANAKNNVDATVLFNIESLETGETVLSGKKDFNLLKDENELSFTISTHKKLKKW
ncbi:sugar-binding domain-containing protein, partial [Mariniphaga sediminis]|uniref:sugar-binding domain-containing protein n=1 Tax=Mariniphaga sediminis TaxID=1628158 RepID=UPI003568B32E